MDIGGKENSGKWKYFEVQELSSIKRRVCRIWFSRRIQKS